MEFPRDFFIEEIREGFCVPEMMKRAWAAEMEILEAIKAVCSDHSIRYYAALGTLLGTVRHKGFIPWDDDIDLFMLRPDYDRFIEVAEENMPEGFVLSGIYGKEARLWEANPEPHTRVMADEKVFSLPNYMNRFHGFPYMRVGIDIFPLDYVPENIDEQYEIVQLVNDLHYTIASWDWLQKNEKLDIAIAGLEKKLGEEFSREDENITRREMRFWADRVAASCEQDHGMVAVITYSQPPGERDTYTGINGLRSEWFGDGTLLRFENTEIMVPQMYEEVLVSWYGKNYMTPQMFTSTHLYPFYKNQEKAFVQLLKDAGINTPVDEFCRNWHRINGGT